MKNSIKLFTLAAVALSCFSCNDWLNVQPKSQVRDTELYSSEAGFKEALAGVYSLLVTESLYTRELRFGMAGVLAQEWSYYSASAYPSEGDYDYTTDGAKSKISAIWNGMYTAVANANVILEEIDSKRNLFTGVNYEVIKGEALALRAFIHFELLRWFGADYAVAPNKPSIPYVTRYSPAQSPQLTVSQLIERVLEDLEDAAELLEADPILTGETVTEFDDNGYLINRQLHLNYYAVKGLQARAYLYKRDHANAALCASEVIDSGQFEWVAQEDFNDGADPAGASEHLWGIDVNNLSTIAENYFSKEAGNNVFSIDISTLEQIYYEGNTEDYRYLNLYVRGEGANAQSAYLAKFNDPTGEEAYYTNKMPMIKLSEMYYILAECLAAQGGSPLEPLNAVRTARGVPALTQAELDQQSFTTRLVTEFRKDFIGEGQLFLLYKRLNLSTIFGTDRNLVDARAYIFPLPDSEKESADRESNI